MLTNIYVILKLNEELIRTLRPFSSAISEIGGSGCTVVFAEQITNIFIIDGFLAGGDVISGKSF